MCSQSCKLISAVHIRITKKSCPFISEKPKMSYLDTVDARWQAGAGHAHTTCIWKDAEIPQTATSCCDNIP
jgi:hypothetical protein